MNEIIHIMIGSNLTEIVDMENKHGSVKSRLDELDASYNEDPKQKKSALVKRIFPDIELLDAVSELRDQALFKGLTKKPLYPGRRSGRDPIAFLLENYKIDIEQGWLGPGQLYRLDVLLYASVRRALDQHNPPLTVGQFFESKTPMEKRGSLHQRRLQACSIMLGVSSEDAIKFMGSMRTDRIPSSLGPDKKYSNKSR